MNNREVLAAITPYIDSVYDSIALRPHVHSGRANSIEAFVRVLEGVMDFLDDGTGPRRRYVDYYCEGQFGAETFRTMFERIHDCQLMFVSNSGNRNEESRTETFDQIYAREFATRWQGFLKWRMAGIQSDPE